MFAQRVSRVHLNLARVDQTCRTRLVDTAPRCQTRVVGTR
jgi:hypothetical protein